jgi:Insertion element 4 transposase N-terminal
MLANVSSRIPPPPWFQHLLPIDLPPAQLDAVSAEPRAPDPAPTPSPREFGFGALSAICDTELVDRVLSECGRLERRCRLLPARLMVYSLLLMCLYPGLGYRRLMHHLAEAAPTPGRWAVPNKSSFARARVRLGTEVMERLFGAPAIRPIGSAGARLTKPTAPASCGDRYRPRARSVSNRSHIPAASRAARLTANRGTMPGTRTSDLYDDFKSPAG